MLKPADEFVARKLAERELNGNYRTLKSESGLVDFCSNDYLGFARSVGLKKAIEKEVNNYPEAFSGSTGSRLLAGNTSYAENLEKYIAARHNSEAGLIFNSGYDANVGLFSSLPQRGDTIITDELIHASVIDGVRLSHANRYTFKHNDMGSLEEKLSHAQGVCYVAIESVYSMDGDSPPFNDIIELVDKYNASLIVDEAHAVGVFGKGLINEFKLENKVFARVVTFGKALGCHGAIVLGNNSLREYLINFARSLIYTTALPLHALVAIKSAYILLTERDNEVKSLKNNIRHFKSLSKMNDKLIKSESAIQCILIKDNEMAKKMSILLQNQGLDIRPILSPTVAKGAERVRICLHSFNTANEIEQLTKTINTFFDVR